MKKMNEMKEFFYDNEKEIKILGEIDEFINTMEFNLQLADEFNSIEKGVIDKKDVIYITLFENDEYRKMLHKSFVNKNHLRYDEWMEVNEKWMKYGRMLFSDRLSESFTNGNLQEFKNTSPFRTINLTSNFDLIANYVDFIFDFDIDLLKNKVIIQPSSKARILDRIKEENTYFLNKKQEVALETVESIIFNFDKLFKQLDITDDDDKKRIRYSFWGLNDKNEKEYIYSRFLSKLE